MKRSSLLAVAGLFGIAASAQAVFLNPNGLGQALVYPYYTVNGGQDTLLTLVNTSGDAKAVKLRFLEGYNGRDALDVNLYLAPGDAWTGAVVAAGDGAALFAGDSSCTVPEVPTDAARALAFSTRAFDGSAPIGADGGPKGLARTREGHIEVIEMGTVRGDSLQALSAHTATGGQPADCGRLRSAWANGGYWANNPHVDLGPPTGGLTGAATIVNVGLGTVQGYVADALAQFHVPNTGTIHTAPEAPTPTLASGTSLTSLTYPSDIPVQSTFARGIDAVSSVFMARSIRNPFWTEQGVAASSEWVITYPTKRFYTDPQYVGDLAQPPFDHVFGGDPAAPGRACSASLEEFLYDNATASITNVEGGFLPHTVSNPRLCYSTQVVTFNQGAGTDVFDHTPLVRSKVLASGLVAANFNAPFQNGWASLGFGFQSPLATPTGARFQGHPVTGFWAAQFINGNVQGSLANYTVAYRHKISSFCSVEAASGAELCR